MAPYECRGSVVYTAWAIGGDSFYFPENVGVGMSGSESDAVQYVLLEIHYDNPLQDDSIIDRPGLRLHYTPTLREYDASVLQISMTVFPLGQFVPPGIEDATNIGYCSSSCLSSNGIG